MAATLDFAFHDCVRPRLQNSHSKGLVLTYGSYRDPIRETLGAFHESPKIVTASDWASSERRSRIGRPMRSLTMAASIQPIWHPFLKSRMTCV
jgi:hypothetical protein